MEYNRIVTLKNGAQCCLRNGVAADGQAVLDNFNLTHEETDFLLTYPEENRFDAAQESQFLQARTDSEREIELIAVVGQAVVGAPGSARSATKSSCGTAPSSASASPGRTGAWGSAGR